MILTLFLKSQKKLDSCDWFIEQNIPDQLFLLLEPSQSDVVHEQAVSVASEFLSEIQLLGILVYSTLF
jgi:hypothetical protein